MFLKHFLFPILLASTVTLNNFGATKIKQACSRFGIILKKYPKLTCSAALGLAATACYVGNRYLQAQRNELKVRLACCPNVTHSFIQVTDDTIQQDGTYRLFILHLGCDCPSTFNESEISDDASYTITPFLVIEDKDLNKTRDFLEYLCWQHVSEWKKRFSWKKRSFTRPIAAIRILGISCSGKEVKLMLQKIRNIKADGQKNLTLVRIPSRKPGQQEIRVEYVVLNSADTDNTISLINQSSPSILANDLINTSLHLAGTTGLNLSAKSTYYKRT